MALLHGKVAKIVWNSQDIESTVDLGQNWTLDATFDVVNITDMGDVWETFEGGFQDWTATVETLLDTAGIDIDFEVGAAGVSAMGMGDVAARLELYLIYAANDYHSLYGDCICTGISPSGSTDDACRVTYTFQGSGTLVWDEDVSRP